MKLQIVSDLHNNWQYVDRGADVLLIAGDFGDGLKELIRLMMQIKDIPVFFVLGNHDYYHETADDVVPLIRALTEDNNWTLLENDVMFYEGVRFVGTTLWTDCGGPANQWFVKQAIKRWPDFVYTKWGGEDGVVRLKQVEDLYPQQEKAVKFLKYAINEPYDGKTVVMTHFVPVKDKATNPKYGKDIANYYFTNDLEYLMGKEMLWHFGHTHDRYDFMVGDTRLVCNPVGYRNELAFQPDLIVEI